jgi:hypothetical protein
MNPMLGYVKRSTWGGARLDLISIFRVFEKGSVLAKRNFNPPIPTSLNTLEVNVMPDVQGMGCWVIAAAARALRASRLSGNPPGRKSGRPRLRGLTKVFYKMVIQH